MYVYLLAAALIEGPNGGVQLLDGDGHGRTPCYVAGRISKESLVSGCGPMRRKRLRFGVEGVMQNEGRLCSDAGVLEWKVQVCRYAGSERAVKVLKESGMTEAWKRD